MQDVTSFVKASSPLSLAPNTGDSKKSGTEKTTNKSFISIMLAQLSETSGTKNTTKISKETEVALPKEDVKNTKTTQQSAKSVDEHLLGDLLKIVDAMKSNTQTTLFPTLKSTARLEKILNSEVALKEFGEVKSISDLMTLSKKYDLGLEKLTFSKESVEKLQKEFPTLAKTNFFETLKEEIKTKNTATETPTPSISPLEKQVTKNEPATPPSVLKDLMSKESVIESKVLTQKETTEIPLKVDEKAMSKEAKIVETSLAETKKAPTQTEAMIQKVAMPTTEEIKTDKKTKPEPLHVISAESETEAKSVPLTRTNELKVESHPTQKGLTETILQTLKVEKPLGEKPLANEESVVIAPTPNVSEESIKHETTEIKPNAIEVKTVQKQETSIKQTFTPKESLNQFANDLREKIENYKPPVMKVELALSPKNLGEVDVTLLTRGSNLHVNISSNTNTMTLFTQNQAEFKNALVNMGFTNLEMNFSDQRESAQQQHKQQKGHAESFDDFVNDQAHNDTTTLEVVIPRYV